MYFLIITFFQNKLDCIERAPEAEVLCSQAGSNMVSEGVFILLHFWTSVEISDGKSRML